MSYKYDYRQLIFAKYRRTLLPPKTVSKLIDRSELSLKNDRRSGIGLPFTRVGNNQNSPVVYLLDDICAYAEDTGY